ncbi:vitamin K epoxide reductase complex subunit 1-like protein 1 isoform X2 [Leguminivora glycinivorella]|nr:vitamin K epoxide reductase complex subunit 1-like protein 1 isoform X2 [Leguminivora glycinivorella]
MGKKALDRTIIGISLVGILISTYALYVEMSAEADPEYKAYCDLSESSSCSKVLTSDFSKGFGLVPKGSMLEIPNCIYGIVFYCLMILMTTYDDIVVVQAQLITSLLSVATCVYLAYLLLCVLKDFCLVCVSTYIVNGSLVYLVYRKLKYLLKKCR